MDTYLFPMSVQSERAPYGLCGWDTQVISIVYMQSPHRLHGLHLYKECWETAL